VYVAFAKTIPLAIKLKQDATCYREIRMAKRDVGGITLLVFADKLSSWAKKKALFGIFFSSLK
jgi:hypothetical protein